MTLTLLGLGPGPADDLSRRAWQALESAPVVVLRTEHHPAVPDLPAGPVYHNVDELASSADDPIAAITQHLLEMAQSGDVVYAVPGDPLVSESTTLHLLNAAREKGINVDVIHGISFIEPVLRQVEIDAVAGLQIQDALAIAPMYHPPINPEYPAIIAQLNSRQIAGQVKRVLRNQYPGNFTVKLIHGAGTNNAQVESVPLDTIDQSNQLGPLTTLYIPPLGELTSFEAFQEVIAHLRAPDGCPWDREQTHESLRPYLLEEAYEVLEAIDNNDIAELYKEMGDLMLQIVLHTQVAIDNGEFYMADVMRYVNQKMIRRHPHVWGDVDVQGDPEQVLTNWEQIKQTENAKSNNGRKSILDGIPKALPSLLVASKYQTKAAKVGFDWPDVGGVEDKIREEMEEIFTAETDEERAREIGDVMFVLVNWLRWLGIEDPESLMREINAKFYQRFRYIEEAVAERGDKPLNEYTLEEMDALWDEGKAKGL